MIAETNEWSLLKRQFDALVDAEGDQRFEKFLDDKVLRRFGELIANAAQHKTHTKGYSQQRRRPASPQRRTSSRR